MSLFFGHNQTLDDGIPTFIMIGDSNADGRGVLATNKYFPLYAYNISNATKTTVKIYDNVEGQTSTFVTLTFAMDQIRQAGYDYSPVQTMMWELAQYYGTQEIRIIKYARGSTFAGIPVGTSSTYSFQPGYQQMIYLQNAYNNALAAAAAEGVSLNIVGFVTFLGTNDATELATANNYQVNMTTIINHIRANVVGNDIPFIITSASELTTYGDTVRTAQQALCAALSGCYYMEAHVYAKGAVHYNNEGIFGVGLEIANSFLVNVLGSSDIHGKYCFKYTTNRSGEYILNLRKLTNIVNYYIDWGDGDTTLVTTNNQNYSHTYTDASQKVLRVLTFLPWNFITINLNGANSSAIVGQFDISMLTGLDTFTVSAGGKGAMTSVVYPLVNGSFKVVCPTNLFNSTGLSSIDFSRLFVNSGGINVKSNSSLTSFSNTVQETQTDNRLFDFQANNALTSLDLSYFSLYTFYIRNNTALITYTHFAITPTVMKGDVYIDGNSVLTTITNYANLIYHSYLDLKNNNITRANMDNIVNEMWDRCQDTTFYKNASNKRFYCQGNNGITGTFDGTTDWSGGLPTSPAAKAYDMLNDVTGTYNFTTFQLT